MQIAMIKAVICLKKIEIKHKHHYVFQAYLDHWAKNDQIWCCRKNKVFLTNTLNIAQERDFYRIKDLNVDEEKIISIFLYNQPKETRETVMNHIKLMRKPIKWKTAIDLFRETLEKKYYQDKNMPFELSNTLEDFQKFADSTVNDLVEDIYSQDEGKAMVFFNQIMNEDLSFFYNLSSEQEDSFCDSKQRFIHFLCSQHFRTKSARDRWVKGMENNYNIELFKRYGIDVTKIRPDHLAYYVFWYIESHVTDMLYQQNAHLTLLVNNTIEPFITSDQPIINMKANYKSVADAPDELIFYYPISPHYAVLLNDKNTENMMLVSNEDVDRYNTMIMNSAYEIIFANDRKLFEKYHF